MPTISLSDEPRARRPRFSVSWPARCLLVLGALLLADPAGAASLFHAQGEMAGEPGADSILLQSRLTAAEHLNEQRGMTGAPGLGRFIIDRGTDEPGAVVTPWLRAEAENDYIIRHHVQGLAPDTRYRYRLEYGRDASHTQKGPPRWFRTLPGPRSTAGLSFLMFNCMGWGQFMDGYGTRPPYDGPDKLLGYPSLVKMQAYPESHFVIGAGDLVYYDTPREATARTLPELRIKWQQQFALPRLVQLLGMMGAFWMKDDHDFRYDDADLTGTREPLPALGIRTFKEQMPVVPQGDVERPTYRTVRAGAHLQLWFLEGRDYRSPNQMEDGPSKTLWGEEQKQWLQRTLRESDARWKLIITPTPMVGPDMDRKRDNHTNSRGFRHEGTQFFAWLKESGLRNVVLFTGDRHWQYHSIHPTGVSEFSCGSLGRENAVGDPPKPGDPGSTDPDRLVEQRYVSSVQEGGFLRVAVDATALLRVDLINHDGVVRYRHEAKP